jgi:hypothetical protein
MQDMGLLPPGDDLVSLGWEELERTVASQRDKVAGVGEEAKQRLSGARAWRGGLLPTPTRLSRPDPPHPASGGGPAAQRPCGPRGAVCTQWLFGLSQPGGLVRPQGRAAGAPRLTRASCPTAGSRPRRRWAPGHSPTTSWRTCQVGGEGAPDEGLLLLRTLHLALQLEAQTVCAAGAAVTAGALPVAQCCGATFRPTRSGAWRRHLPRRCERARACRCDCCSEGCIGL